MSLMFRGTYCTGDDGQVEEPSFRKGNRTTKTKSGLQRTGEWSQRTYAVLKKQRLSIEFKRRETDPPPTQKNQEKSIFRVVSP